MEEGWRLAGVASAFRWSPLISRFSISGGELFANDLFEIVGSCLKWLEIPILGRFSYIDILNNESFLSTCFGLC